MFKSGFASIIGKPNAGKSTLLNSLVGEKICIVSKKPQTTRKNQKGIYSDENCQIVFLDTPGINKPKNKLDEYMQSSVKDSFDGIDVVLLVVDILTYKDTDFENIKLYLKSVKIKKILIFNKLDVLMQINPKINNDDLVKIKSEFENNLDIKFDDCIFISALKNKQVNDVIETIKKFLPEGVAYYPDDEITDMPLKEIVAEKIRQHALYKLDKEIPHGIAVLCNELKYSKNGTCHINADIYCEKENHKRIIIGKGGETLKQIGTGARIEIEKFMGCKVNLHIFVSIKKNWRDEVIQLANFGYKQ